MLYNVLMFLLQSANFEFAVHARGESSDSGSGKDIIKLGLSEILITFGRGRI